MQEQSKFLTSKGLQAVYIGEDYADITTKINKGQYNYIFGSPESLLGKHWKLFTNPIYKERLGAVFKAIAY